VLYILFSKNIGLNIENYPLYVLIGVIHWHFFNVATSDSTRTFWFFLDIVKKTNANRLIMVLGVILSCFYSYLIEFIILSLIICFTIGLSWTAALVIYIFILELLLVTSIALIFSVYIHILET